MGRVGYALRVKMVRAAFDRIPPYTLRDAHGVTVHSCGGCFQKLGDEPFGGRAGTMTPGVPPGAICGFCGKRADPTD